MHYEVTAITGAGESLPSAEVSTAVGDGGAIHIDWGDVPGALSYQIYRISAPSGVATGYFTSTLPTFFDNGAHGADRRHAAEQRRW